MGALFIQYFPLALGIIFLIVGCYNLVRDKHVKAAMHHHGIPAWLRWPTVFAEAILAGGLIVLNHPSLAPLVMLLSLLFLLGSFAVCLLSGWHRRIWLSGPLILSCLLWLYLVVIR